jgi:hypothetical protein
MDSLVCDLTNALNSNQNQNSLIRAVVLGKDVKASKIKRKQSYRINKSTSHQTGLKRARKRAVGSTGTSFGSKSRFGLHLQSFGSDRDSLKGHASLNEKLEKKKKLRTSPESVKQSSNSDNKTSHHHCHHNHHCKSNSSKLSRVKRHHNSSLALSSKSTHQSSTLASKNAKEKQIMTLLLAARASIANAGLESPNGEAKYAKKVTEPVSTKSSSSESNNHQCFVDLESLVRFKPFSKTFKSSEKSKGTGLLKKKMYLIFLF